MTKATVALTLLLIQMLGVVGQQQPAPITLPRPDAQKPAPDDDVVRVTTNLVQVDAVITDGKGQIVKDLRPDEVQILEDGKPRDITNFSFIALQPSAFPSGPTKVDKNAPIVPPSRLKAEQIRRTIALVVDDLGLSFESTYYAREALKKFVEQQMQSDDLVAIIRTGGGVGALQQFTSDKRQLLAAIERVKWNPTGRGSVGTFAPISNNSISNAQDQERQVANETVDDLRQQIFSVGTLGAVRYVISGLSELPGRKSVILLSDGLSIINWRDLTTKDRVLNSMRRLIELANRASVVIYTVDARGLPTLSLTASDSVGGLTVDDTQTQLDSRRREFFESQGGLAFLAEETGGFAIRNSNDLAGGIRKVVQSQQGYYLIGYRPDPSTFVAANAKQKFHRLSLKVLRPGNFTVRMRSGFFGVPDEEVVPKPATPEQRMIAALISPFGSADINLRLTSLFANDGKLGSVMRSYLHIDMRDLTLTDEADGWKKATFDIMAVTFGDNGVPVDQLNRRHTVRLRGGTYQQALKRGLTYHLLVPVKKPGAYQLRTSLRDLGSDRIGSASQFIEVPNINNKRLAMSGILVMSTPLEVFRRRTSGEMSNAGAEAAAAESEERGTAVLREFHKGDVLEYAFVVYNAKVDKSRSQPQLTMQLRLFRMGQPIFTGKELSFDGTGQTDLRRLTAGGAIQLGSDMQPGEYVLQVVVTDLLAKGKYRSTTQWIDFEIVN